MEGGTGFEPVNGDFADHSVSLFATRPNVAFKRKIDYTNFTPAWQAKQKRYPG